MSLCFNPENSVFSVLLPLLSQILCFWNYWFAYLSVVSLERVNFSETLHIWTGFYFTLIAVWLRMWFQIGNNSLSEFWRLCSVVFRPFWVLLRSRSHCASHCIFWSRFFLSGSSWGIFSVQLFWNFTMMCCGLDLFSSIMLSTQRALLIWRPFFSWKFSWFIFWLFLSHCFLFSFPLELHYLDNECSWPNPVIFISLSFCSTLMEIKFFLL